MLAFASRSSSRWRWRLIAVIFRLLRLRCLVGTLVLRVAVRLLQLCVLARVGSVAGGSNQTHAER